MSSNTRPFPARTGSLRAGVAKCDITMDDPAIGVHDRLYAKALALDDGDTRLVIVCVDAVAIGGICDVNDAFLPRLRSRIETELGVPGGHVLVSATHTHPPGRILCDDREQVARTFDAVRAALDHLTPVRVGVGRGREDRIIINRNLRLKGGGHWTIRHTNPCPPDDRVEALNRVDPEIGVLRIDRADGTPLAVLFNYACHPLIGVPSRHVTANYPGFAANIIEETLGHGAMALFLQGAAGDVIEVLFKDPHRPMHSEPVGAVLAQSTLRAYRAIHPRDGATLGVVSETIRLPRRADSAERIEALRLKQAELLGTLRYMSMNFRTFLPLYLQHALNPRHPSDYAYRYLHEQSIGSHDLAEMDAFNRHNIERYLQNIRTMEELARIEDELATYRRHQAINAESGETTIACEVQGIRVGDCVLVSAPIELLTEVGLNVKRASPHEHTFIAAFANGYMHYGAPASDYDKGGYEVIECLLAPQWQALYEGKANEILHALAKASRRSVAEDGSFFEHNHDIQPRDAGPAPAGRHA